MPKILIAEDEAHILRVMSMWLHRHGYDIIEAVNGAAALERLRQEPVDMIISDMNMPELDGFQLVQAVRDRLRLKVPFLLLTARCDHEALLQRLAPYQVQLYPKPFVPSRLVADIDALLGTGAASGDRP